MSRPMSEAKLEILENQAHKAEDTEKIDLCREIRRLQARVAHLSKLARQYRPDIKILGTEDGDWYVVFVNGKRRNAGHSVRWDELLRALGVPDPEVVRIANETDTPLEEMVMRALDARTWAEAMAAKASYDAAKAMERTALNETRIMKARSLAEAVARGGSTPVQTHGFA